MKVGLKKCVYCLEEKLSLSSFPEISVIPESAPEKTFTSHFTSELVSSYFIDLEEKLHLSLISVVAPSV